MVDIYYRQRKQKGLCTFCGEEAHVDPRSLKKRTLCLKHLIENRERKRKWKLENPELHQASMDREKKRRKELRRKKQFSTKRVAAYLQWLYGALDRLRDIDAQGDAKPPEFKTWHGHDADMRNQSPAVTR